MIDAMKRTIGFIDGRMDSIEQISLEDEFYNELYLSLREMRNVAMKVIKAQYIIDQRVDDDLFWDGMRKIRKPEEGADVDADVEKEKVKNTKRV